MDDEIDVIESRTPAGVGFSFKVRDTGRLYRLEPMRHPRQPRFWCFRVFRCLPGGRADPSERPWLGGEEMTLSDLPDEVATIRANVGEWLGRREHRELSEWVFAKPPAPTDDEVAVAR